MSGASIAQTVLFFVVLFAFAIPLGSYMARVYEGKATTAQKLFGWLERLLYRLFGVDPKREQSWQRYAVALLLSNLLGMLAVYGLQRLQTVLPGNPNDLVAVPPNVAWNTAVSFASNTNWQAYGGETTMSNLVQALALGVQNFVSAATGMAVLVALVRGFMRRHSEEIGNFWVDLTRAAPSTSCSRSRSCSPCSASRRGAADHRRHGARAADRAHLAGRRQSARNGDPARHLHVRARWASRR